MARWSRKHRNVMPMYWNMSFGWADLFWMMAWMTLWVGVFGLVIWAMMRSFGRRYWQPVRHHEWHIQSNEPSALEILNRRYARGELDSATYESMRERIQASASDYKLLVSTPVHR